MKEKYFFIILLLLSSLYSFGQAIGDFQSKSNGNWNSASSWLTWNGTWVDATSYPGETAGSYSVTIQTGHAITILSDLTTASMGTILINGTLNLNPPSPNIVTLSTLDLIIDGGTLTFVGAQLSLKLPLGSALEIKNSGKIDGNCSHNDEIFIGNQKYAVCRGATSNEYLTFGEINESGGTISAVILTPAANTISSCKDQSITLQGKYAGVAGGTVTYSWTISHPDGTIQTIATGNLTDNTAISSTSFIPTFFGDYLISFKVSTLIGSTNFSNTETRIVTVEDNQNPTIATLAGISVTIDTGSCSYASSQLTKPAATDNCILGSVVATPATLVLGSNTVTWTAIDSSGKTATSTQTVVVTDNINPTISCPTNMTANVGAGTCIATLTTPNPTIADNCSISKLTWVLTGATTGTSAATGINNLPPKVFNLGTTTVTYTLTDAANNSASCSYTVTVSDNINPTISCPTNMTVNVGAGTCTATVTTPNPTITDNCSISKLTWVLTGATTGTSAATGINNLPPKVFNLGTTTVTYTLTDAANNSTSCSYTVIVSDNINPTISCPANLTANTGTGTCTASVATPNPTIADNCSVTKLTWALTGATAGTSPITGINNLGTQIFNLGTTTVTYTAYDAANRSVSCSYTVKIADNEAPKAICKNITISLDTSGNASITASQINNNSTDNCGIQSITIPPTNFTCTNVGSNPVTLTVTDVNGNSAICNAIVTVVDPAASASVNISASPAGSICQGTPVTFTATISGAGSNPRYQWYEAGSPVGANTNKYTTSTLNNGDSVFVVFTSGSCNAIITSSTINAIINASPIVSAPAALCIGGTASLSPTTGGTWISNNPTIATVTSLGIISGISTGSATFKFTNSVTGCSSTTASLTVNALPVVSAPISVCINATGTLSPSTGGTWISSNTSVATVTNSGIITGVSDGTATFTFTNSATGCSKTTAAVTINPLPIITSLTASPSTVCSGDQSTLDVVVQGTATNSTTLVNYNFNSGSTYANLGSNAATGITSSISSTNSPFDTNNGGVNTTATAFASNTAGNYLNASSPNLSWVFTLGGTDLANYTGFKIYFQARREDSNNSKTITVTFKKNGGSSTTVGTVILNRDDTWFVAGGATGFLTMPAGAANATTLEITLTITGNGNSDIGIDNFQIQGTKSGGNYLYSWTALPAATAGLPANAGVASVNNKTIPVFPTETTNYTVAITNSNGCVKTQNVTVTVNPNPNISVFADYCYAPNKVKLATNPSPLISSYLWSNGATTPTISVDIAGYYQVIVTTTNGCKYIAGISVAEELVTNGSFTDGNIGFTSDYAYKPDLPGLVPPGQGELYNDTGNNGYSITTNGQNVHTNFWGQDHTNNNAGNRNFMAVNGHGNTLVVWKETVTVEPNTTYYFSAWAMSLNNASPFATLQFQVNGTLVGTTAALASHGNSLTSPDNWIRFYGTWTSGPNVTTADVSIRDLQAALGGNDFGIDDISFGTLSPFLFLSSATGTDQQVICQNSPITEITYSVGSGITAPTVTGLPAGISTSYNGLTLSFKGSPTEVGTFNYKITTTGSCTTILTALGTITINPKATVDAGPDQTVCSTKNSVNLNAILGGSGTSGTWSGGSGTFDNPSLSNAVYTLGTSDTGTITLTYTSNNPDGICDAGFDTVNIQIIPYQIARAGTATPSINCDNRTILLSGNGTIGQWTVTSRQTPSTYSFSNATSPTSTFTGESGETYILTWTITNTSPCGNSSDNLTFKFADCSAIDFDGIDDNITFNDNYNLNNSSFSIEIWVKPDAINGNIKTIISKRDANNFNTGYDLRLINNKISFYTNNSEVLSFDGLTRNRWYHLAVTFDGSAYKLYIDGKNMVTATGVAPIVNSNSFLIGAMNGANNSSVNYFKGWMDELRIWNVCLTVNQIHKMMNQEIQNNGGNVYGSIVPLPIYDLKWSNLAGYYQMNQGTPDIAGGFLNETGFISGKLRNITTFQAETSPLPYYSAANGNWDNPNTWRNGFVQSIPNSTGGLNTTNIDWNIVNISHDIISLDAGGSDGLTLLGLLSNNGKLTIAANGALNEKNTGKMLNITHYLKLNGVIDLVGESQLLQKRYYPYPQQYNESVFDEASSGYIERDQQGQKNSFNYNYWTSPVSMRGGANNSPYTISSILKDGTDSANPKIITFGDGAYFADGTLSSPIKISNRWILTYNATTPDSNSEWDNFYQWKLVGSAGLIKVGDGFSMKGTGGTAAINTTQNYVFVGKPNSGDITTSFLTTDQTYLIGNPYPSALDADAFIRNNLNGCSGCTGASSTFNGVLYYWDHFGLSNNHLLAQYEGGYAIYSLAGGLPAVDDSSLTSGTSNPSSRTPGRYIPVGQAFFVDATPDPSVQGSISSATTPGYIYFKNSQRAFIRETSGSSIFMKTVATKNSKEQNSIEDKRLKIRLGFISATGSHRQILLTADANTTNQFDIGYDAPMIDMTKNDMYWEMNDRPFAIQAIPEINKQQTIPLGITVAAEGSTTIKIDALENIPTTLEIYLYDKLTQIYHDIRNKDFSISLPIGEYNKRFSLQFENKTLISDELNSNEEFTVFYSNNSKMLNIINNLIDTKVTKVYVFNILGQNLGNWAIKDQKQNNIQIPIKNINKAIYIIKIITDKGEFSKKINIE